MVCGGIALGRLAVERFDAGIETLQEHGHKAARIYVSEATLQGYLLLMHSESNFAKDPPPLGEKLQLRWRGLPVDAASGIPPGAVLVGCNGEPGTVIVDGR